MARQSRPTFQKRLKEKARMEKAREKVARRLESQERKAATEPLSIDGEDPDIAGIRPGPQSVPDEWAPFMPEEEESEDETVEIDESMLRRELLRLREATEGSPEAADMADSFGGGEVEEGEWQRHTARVVVERAEGESAEPRSVDAGVETNREEGGR